MSNPYQPGPIAGGVEKLMGSLLGGADTRQAAQQKEEMRLRQMQSVEATIDGKMTDALLKRDKRMAQQQYEADLTANGLPPAAARMMSNLMVGGNGGQIKAVQDYSIRDRLPAMFQAEGFTPANAQAAAYAPKPIENVKIQAGHILEDLFSAAPSYTPTQKESAAIETQEARTEVAQAQEAGVHARTAATRDRTANPAKYRAAGGGKGGKDSVDDLMGHPGAGVKPDAQDMKDFATDPKKMARPFIEAFGWDAYMEAQRRAPSLKKAITLPPATEADVEALWNGQMSDEDFAKQFGQAALTGVKSFLDKKKDRK